MTLMPWHRRPTLPASPGPLLLSPCQAAIFLLSLAAYDGLVRRWTTTCQPPPYTHPGGCTVTPHDTPTATTSDME